MEIETYKSHFIRCDLCHETEYTDDLHMYNMGFDNPEAFFRDKGWKDIDIEGGSGVVCPTCSDLIEKIKAFENKEH